jgi:hypothetical protein
MKLIRSSAFETNSSSCHSFTFRLDPYWSRSDTYQKDAWRDFVNLFKYDYKHVIEEGQLVLDYSGFSMTEGSSIYVMRDDGYPEEIQDPPYRMSVVGLDDPLKRLMISLLVLVAWPFTDDLLYDEDASKARKDIQERITIIKEDLPEDEKEYLVKGFAYLEVPTWLHYNNRARNVSKLVGRLQEELGCKVVIKYPLPSSVSYWTGREEEFVFKFALEQFQGEDEWEYGEDFLRESFIVGPRSYYIYSEVEN